MHNSVDNELRLSPWTAPATVPARSAAQEILSEILVQNAQYDAS